MHELPAFRPAFSAANPGKGSDLTVDVTNAEGIREAKCFDLVEILIESIQEQGLTCERKGEWICVEGWWFGPRFVSIDVKDDGKIATCTTIQACHPDLCSKGIFEYQHAFPLLDVGETLRGGFYLWTQFDLPVFLTTVSKIADCMSWKMDIPEKDNRPPRTRQIVFGPTWRYQPNPPEEQPEDTPDACADDAHEVCDCCLFSNSLECFMPLLEQDDFYALRFFAARDEDGRVSADCRVNGEGWAEGAQALADYAATWRGGYEFRKQLVVIRTLPVLN